MNHDEKIGYHNNTIAGLIANYLVTDMDLAPEAIEAPHVIEAMKAGHYHGYTMATFINRDRSIREDLFAIILEHAKAILEYGKTSGASDFDNGFDNGSE